MVVLNDEKHLTESKKQEQSCSGYCTSCSTVHSLASANAREKGKELIRQLEERKSIQRSDTVQDPRLSTESLFGEQRGKMFGVLECLDQNGEISWLYAFSGQFNGLWAVDGWAPPLFDIPTFKMVHDPVEKRIKALGKEMERVPAGSDLYLSLLSQRRQLSRQLMIDLHDLYLLHNFTGDTATLHQAFIQPGGKPTGTGDCCAPKLLQLAAATELLPLSLAEFFYGRSNRSGSRNHGCFYSPCSDKCQPLLGFLLCGIEQRTGNFVN